MNIDKLRYWTNRNGDELLIKEMTSDHIQKCIWMLTPKNNSGRFTNSICGLSLELANRDNDESSKILKIKEIIKLHPFFKANEKSFFITHVIGICSNPLILLELEKHYVNYNTENPKLEDEVLKQIIRNHKNYRTEAQLVLDSISNHN